MFLDRSQTNYTAMLLKKRKKFCLCINDFTIKQEDELLKTIKKYDIINKIKAVWRIAKLKVK
jgi:hypothetical protein